MPGKVLGGGEHAVRPGTTNVGRDQIPNLQRVLAEGARADDRVQRIGIHIGDRKQIPMHAQRAAFLRGDAAEGFRIGKIAGGAERHGVRKDGGPEQAGRQDATLKVSGNQQRQFGFELQLVQQTDSFVAIVTVKKMAFRGYRHGKRTHMVFMDVIAQQQVFGTARREQFRPHAHHEQLADFFFERERV